MLSLKELEEFHPGLLEAKKDRKTVEYYFTCTPALVEFVLAKVDVGQFVTYVDGDISFCGNPEPLFQSFAGYSVSIIPHLFSKWLKDREKYGLFNVGFLSFRKDDSGTACLRWWRDRCVEWCFDRLDGDRFADQKYLNHFPFQYSGVQVITNRGANLAPWNVGNGELIGRKGKIYMNGDELLFYHFHGLRRIHRGLFDLGLDEYVSRVPRVLKEFVYDPYLRTLRDVQEQWLPVGSSEWAYGNQRIRKEYFFDHVASKFPRSMVRMARGYLHIARKILQNKISFSPFLP